MCVYCVWFSSDQAGWIALVAAGQYRTRQSDVFRSNGVLVCLPCRYRGAALASSCRSAGQCDHATAVTGGHGGLFRYRPLTLDPCPDRDAQVSKKKQGNG